MGHGTYTLHEYSKNEKKIEHDYLIDQFEKIDLQKTFLKSHPNYKDCKPIKGESQISFTLRAIAHLVSPPQEPHESTTIECVDLRDAILSMEEE